MLFVDNILTLLNIYRKHNILHNNIKIENTIFNGECFYLIGLSKSHVSSLKGNKFNNSSDMNAFSEILVNIIDGKNTINMIEVESLINNHFLKLD